MKTMKAVLYEKPGRENASVTQVPYPVCGDEEVIIKVASAGICKGADSDLDQGKMPFGKYPLTPGHEFSGTIVEAGKDVSDFLLGDRVTANNAVPCGDCYYCKRNLPNYCDNYGSIGSNINGGFAEYVLVHKSKLYHIPDHVSFNAASITEPVATSINAMDRLDVKYGENIVVFGAGPNGCILAQLLKHSNAAKVVVAASTQNKLDLLEQYGIETILIDRNDPTFHERKLREMFPNGLDAIVDATGAVKLISSCFALLRKGGRLLQYSVPHGNVEIDAFDFSVRELQYLSACAQTHCFDRAVEAISSGIVNTDMLITHEFPLEDYFKALDLNLTDRSVMKAIIHP